MKPRKIENTIDSKQTPLSCEATESSVHHLSTIIYNNRRLLLPTPTTQTNAECCGSLFTSDSNIQIQIFRHNICSSMKFSIAFGLLLVSGGGILPPALARSPPPLPRDSNHNNEPTDDVGPAGLLGSMSGGGAAASTSDYHLGLGSAEPKDEVRI